MRVSCLTDLGQSYHSLNCDTVASPLDRASGSMSSGISLRQPAPWSFHSYQKRHFPPFFWLLDAFACFCNFCACSLAFKTVCLNIWLWSLQCGVGRPADALHTMQADSLWRELWIEWGVNELCCYALCLTTLAMTLSVQIFVQCFVYSMQYTLYIHLLYVYLYIRTILSLLSTFPRFLHVWFACDAEQRLKGSQPQTRTSSKLASLYVGACRALWILHDPNRLCGRSPARVIPCGCLRTSSEHLIYKFNKVTMPYIIFTTVASCIC